jgi:hypothetical protein
MKPMTIAGVVLVVLGVVALVYQGILHESRDGHRYRISARDRGSAEDAAAAAGTGSPP